VIKAPAGSRIFESFRHFCQSGQKWRGERRMSKVEFNINHKVKSTGFQPVSFSYENFVYVVATAETCLAHIGF